MKIIKLASDKKQVVISKNEWLNIGYKLGWVKTAAGFEDLQLTKDNVTIIPRNESLIRDLIKSFGSRRFKIGYQKKDGTFRIFYAQKRVSKYKFSPGAGTEVPEYLFLVYDLIEAQKISKELNIDIMNPDGTVNEEKASIRERELRKAYRSIYPEKIDIIKAGKIWLVEDPVTPEGRFLMDKAIAAGVSVPGKISEEPTEELQEQKELTQA